MGEHPLDAWLAANGRTRTWLAEQIGTSTATLSRLMRGKQWPSREIADRIRAITGGAVTPNDFLGDGQASVERNDEAASRPEAAE